MIVAASRSTKIQVIAVLLFALVTSGCKAPRVTNLPGMGWLGWRKDQPSTTELAESQSNLPSSSAIPSAGELGGAESRPAVSGIPTVTGIPVPAYQASLTTGNHPQNNYSQPQTGYPQTSTPTASIPTGNGQYTQANHAAPYQYNAGTPANTYQPPQANHAAPYQYNAGTPANTYQPPQANHTAPYQYNAGPPANTYQPPHYASSNHVAPAPVQAEPTTGPQNGMYAPGAAAARSQPGGYGNTSQNYYTASQPASQPKYDGHSGQGQWSYPNQSAAPLSSPAGISNPYAAVGNPGTPTPYSPPVATPAHSQSPPNYGNAYSTDPNTYGPGSDVAPNAPPTNNNSLGGQRPSGVPAGPQSYSSPPNGTPVGDSTYPSSNLPLDGYAPPSSSPGINNSSATSPAPLQQQSSRRPWRPGSTKDYKKTSSTTVDHQTPDADDTSQVAPATFKPQEQPSSFYGNANAFSK